MTEKPASRYPLELDILFKKSYAREADTGTLKNVSITGAFIENSTTQFKNRDKITITLNLSGRERHIAATVVWANQRGCGVRFAPFNNQDIQIVDDLIYFLESKRESRKDVLSSIFKKVS